MPQESATKPAESSPLEDMVQVGVYMLQEHKDWLKAYAKKIGEVGYTAAIRHLIRKEMDAEKAVEAQAA